MIEEFCFTKMEVIYDNYRRASREHSRKARIQTRLNEIEENLGTAILGLDYKEHYRPFDENNPGRS